MNWLEKYKPNFLSELKTNKSEIEKAIKWIKDYKKNSESTKKVLFIIGPTGVGKTYLADLLFKEYNYQKIELNSTDVRSQKKIGEFLKKSLTYKNVIDMFNDGNLPIGILMDEIDSICKLSDKGGFTEFLNLLKYNDKYETYKKNINDKKKSKKIKITVDEYIKLYNPIICTSSDINDKKINELKKYSEVIYLRKPSNDEMASIIDDLYSKNKQDIEKIAKLEIINHAQGDIRRLIILLEDLHYYADNNKITYSMIEDYKKVYKDKEEDIQLIQSTKILLHNKLEVAQCEMYFDVDCLLTPLMIYHNSIDFIKNTEDTSNKKLSCYKNILESLCIHDTIQTNIFEVQDWDELYHIAAFYGAAVPNYHFNLLKTKKKTVEIQFTSLLNKISQMYVNKKLLNGAKFSIGKLNYDTNEIIYLTEIMSKYFDNYKSNVNFDANMSNVNFDANMSNVNFDANMSSVNFDDDDSDEDEEDKVEDENNDNIGKICIKKPLENNSDLVVFMNKYGIDIDGLENILKIEKLNLINEKRKKKFTLKIKKEISNFLIK
jgi:DNA polymerase III delta prime subunit